MKFWVSFAALFLLALPAPAQEANVISLRSGTNVATVNPATLRVEFQAKGNGPVLISSAQSNLGGVTELKTGTTKASWRLPDIALAVAMQLEGENLAVNFRADRPGAFTWPLMFPEAKAWILPMAEGAYVPVDDANWISFLSEHGSLNTTADLGLPFWGWDCGGFTVTWIVTNPFNNELTFTNNGGRLAAQFRHEFTRNNPVKEFGFVIQIGKASPVEPARVYRQWLQDRGEFVSMKEKIKRTPDAEKLLGAAHIYLWGDELIAADDIKDWKQFAKQLPMQGGRFWEQMRPEIRTVVTNAANAEWVDRYAKSQITDELNRLLKSRDAAETNLTDAAHCQRNCDALAKSFAGLLAPTENWGDGISSKMISRLAQTGLDRLWLGTPGWEGLVRRPETVAAARKAGYLIGTYDSYHSIHSPKAKGDDTWATAQFDQELFDTGPIVLADGLKKSGFKQKGFNLSPAAARPYVEKRVNGLMKIFNANSWFMDCDGFGEFFDDYSPAHPATQQSDLQARCSRMAWIRDTFETVMGTEGCSAGVASSVHFAHGVMTPVIGWGDPDLNNKSSKYYLGAWYPPNGPAVFFKPVPTKEKYRYLYFDPRFRLPLFQTVFHDSVVATHHWSAASGKFSDQTDTVALLELLYQVPPLYHLNLDEFGKRKAEMKKHHDFFSPLHRETGLLPLTEFEWLTPDRLVQRSGFGGSIELTANFRESAYSVTGEGNSVPPRSILARDRATGTILVFTPGKSK